MRNIFQSFPFSQVMTLLIVAIALGMDAMSLGLGLGMKGLSKREITTMSLTIGVFHIFMPLLGLFLGIYLHKMVGEIAKLFGSLLLVYLGGQMIYQSFTKRETFVDGKTSGIGLLLFAMSVSIDALSVGFSLGIYEANITVVVTLFGIVGACMAAIGLSLGVRVKHVFGKYSECIGGGILILFGIKFLL